MAVFRIVGENSKIFGDVSFNRGVRYLRNYSSLEVAQMRKQMLHIFRCRTSDGVIVFWGRCSSRSYDPLIFGDGYGASTIEYKNPSTGVWEVL